MCYMVDVQKFAEKPLLLNKVQRSNEGSKSISSAANVCFTSFTSYHLLFYNLLFEAQYIYTSNMKTFY